MLTAVQRGASAPVFGSTVCVIKRSWRLSPARIARDLQEAGKNKTSAPTCATSTGNNEPLGEDQVLFPVDVDEARYQ